MKDLPVASSRPPALLFGEGITCLGTLRALSRADVTCFVVGNDDPVLKRSRWYRAAPPMDERSLEEYLASLPFQTAVLFPCSDDWAEEIAGIQDEELKRRFSASISSVEVLRDFLDKGRFARLLQRESIPHPRTVLVDGEGDLEAEVDGIESAFIKPRDSQAFMKAFGEKAFWPDSPADLSARLESLADQGISVIVQEYIPGPASDHYFVDGFVDSDGAMRAVLARRRLRMHPPKFGNSSYMETVSPEEVGNAIPDLERLLGPVGYRGIFSAEFKRDSRDGLFKILEVNARPWWFVEFAANCGVDVLAMSYQDALGLPIQDMRTYVKGKRLIHPYYDISACSLSEGGRIRGLGMFLRSVPGAEQPVFCWDDYRPTFESCLRLMKNYLGRRFGRRTGS